MHDQNSKFIAKCPPCGHVMPLSGADTTWTCSNCGWSANLPGVDHLPPWPNNDPDGLKTFVNTIHRSDHDWFVTWLREHDSEIGTFLPWKGNQRGEVFKYIRKQRKAGHLYLSLGSQAKAPPHKKRGMSKDVATIAAIWAEIDTADGKHAHDNLPPDTESALKLIDHMPPPSFVLHSGGGIQVYWFLDQPCSTEKTQVVDMVEAVQWSIGQRAKEHGWHVDMLADAARVFRLPGTLNFKHTPPRPTKTLICRKLYYNVNTFAPIHAAWKHDDEQHAHRTARSRQKFSDTKYPSIAAFNRDHDIVAMLESAGYTREGGRYRSPDSDRAYAAGVVIDRGANMAFHWDLADPLHHGKSACAASTPFSVFVTFEHNGDFKAAMSAIHQAGWHDEEPFELQADTIIDTRYLSDAIDELPAARGVIIKSEIGTGKTELLSQITKGKRVLVIGHRRNLLRNIAKRLEIDYYEDILNSGGKLEACHSLAICLDSIVKLDTHERYDLVLIDESEQVLRHATGSTIKRDRQMILEYFQHFQETAVQCVCMDAHAGRITYEYVTNILGKRNTHVILNTHAPGGKTYVAYDKDNQLKAAIIKAVQRGERIAIAANSKKTVKALERMLHNLNNELEIFAIHGDNADDQDVRDFITHINDRVRDLDVLIYSPSLGTGVSIDVPDHFHAVYAFGHAEPTTHYDILQQCGRVRNTIKQQVHCWISCQRRAKPTNIDNLKNWCIKNAEETGLIIGINTTGELFAKDNSYLQLWANVESERNASMNELRRHFYEAVRAAGHKVINAEDISKEESREARLAYEEGRDGVFLDFVTELKELEPLTYEQAEEIRNKLSATEEERMQVYQYDICRFYNIPPDEITEDLIKADERGLRRQAEQFAMVLKPDMAKKRDFVEGDHLPLPDRSNYYTAAKLRTDIIKQIGFTAHHARSDDHRDDEHTPDPPADDSGGDSSGVTTHAVNLRSESMVGADPPDIPDATVYTIHIPDTFAGWLEQHRNDIYSKLGLTVQKDIHHKPQQFVTTFYNQIGIAIKSRQFRQNGQRVREYYITMGDARRAEQWAKRWLALHESLGDIELPTEPMEAAYVGA